MNLDTQMPISGQANLWTKAMKRIQQSSPKMWQNYDQRIREEMADPDKTIGESLQATLEKARADYRDTKWKYTREDGTEVVFQAVVDDIIESIGSVKEFGAALASCDPFHVASVGWAGIQFFVKILFPIRTCKSDFTNPAGICKQQRDPKIGLG